MEITSFQNITLTTVERSTVDRETSKVCGCETGTINYTQVYDCQCSRHTLKDYNSTDVAG